MMRRILERCTVQSLLSCMLALAVPATAADQPMANEAERNAAGTSEIEQLKKMLLDQQRQIDELRRALLEKNEPNAPDAHPSSGQVASTTPIVPPSPAPVTSPVFNPPAIAPPQPKPASESSPLQFKIGDAYITPVGFMDFTSITRSINTGNGIGTNFGSVPYGNTQQGALTEWRLSPQNSRVGFRVDALAKDWRVLGYLETDFLGQIGAPPNGGIAVSSNPYPLRLRLYWVDLKKGKSEVLAGQTWGLMTPNRKGLSPLPGDLFYSQDIDVNYQAGLVWGRIPEFRYVYHPSDTVAVGFALSNSEPYVGGANGGSAITFPAWVGSANAVSGAVLGGQINNGQSVISAAALHPDIIAKVAFDPNSKVHFEIAGVEITNKVANPATNPPFRRKHLPGPFRFYGDRFRGDCREDAVLWLLRRGLHRAESGARHQRRQDRLRPDRKRWPKPLHPARHVRHQHHADARSQVGRDQSHVPILLSPAESVACNRHSPKRRSRPHGFLQSPLHIARVRSDPRQVIRL